MMGSGKGVYLKKYSNIVFPSLSAFVAYYSDEGNTPLVTLVTMPLVTVPPATMPLVTTASVVMPSVTMCVAFYGGEGTKPLVTVPVPPRPVAMHFVATPLVTMCVPTCC